MSQLAVFGRTAAGETVHRIVLKRDSLRAEIITLGAAVRDLRLAGHAAPLVLGLNSVAEYEAHGLYFGAIVGRVANRIAGARAHILNHPYALTPNDYGNILHGG
ncbi:MAG: galactose-1-epimerase, partial [Pseudomonadota bacterium]